MDGVGVVETVGRLGAAGRCVFGHNERTSLRRQPGTQTKQSISPIHEHVLE